MAAWDADYSQAEAWLQGSKDRLEVLYKRLRKGDLVTPELMSAVSEDIETAQAMIHGVFGTAMRARQDLNREVERYHALREEWEDKHHG